MKKKKSKNKKIKYPKKQKTSTSKRTIKEIYDGKKPDTPIKKKRNKPNKNKENTNIIKYSITNLYDNLVINNSEKIEVTIDNLKNDIYEEEFFNLNEITGDGNCFFRTLSYYLYNNENSHKNLRDSAYQYVSNNIN